MYRYWQNEWRPDYTHKKLEKYYKKCELYYMWIYIKYIKINKICKEGNFWLYLNVWLQTYVIIKIRFDFRNRRFCYQSLKID